MTIELTKEELRILDKILYDANKNAIVEFTQLELNKLVAIRHKIIDRLK